LTTLPSPPSLHDALPIYPSLKVIVSGSHGLIGSALVDSLEADGHQVTRLVRDGADGVPWDPMAGTIDAAGLEGHDAVVHLAGARSEEHTSELQSRVDLVC